MSKAFSISLVRCPCWGISTPPLATALLAGNLRSKGYNVHSFDLNHELFVNASTAHKMHWKRIESSFWESQESIDQIFKEYRSILIDHVHRIIKTDSKVVGFSFYITTVRFTLEFIRLLKRHAPDILTVAGGPSAHEYLLVPDSSGIRLVDAVVEGEGDETLPELCASLKKTGRLKKIPGLIYVQNGRSVRGGKRKPITSLDLLPFPDYSDYDLNSYRSPDCLNLFASRGCVNRCHFCCEWSYFRPFRARSGKNLFEEVSYHRSQHPNVASFNFSDSVFNGSLKTLREFSSLLLKNKVKVVWGGQGTFRNGMTKELIQLMARAGCVRISYGLESGSEKVRRSMNKARFSNKLAEQILRSTHDAGISTCVYIMLGYPTETEVDFQMTLEFIQNARAWIDEVDPSKSYTAILPDTHLYNHPEEFGVKPERNLLFCTFWETVDGKNTFPLRVERYERLCALCRELGYIHTDFTEERSDKWKTLGHYYFYKNDYKEARECYKMDLQKHGPSPDSEHFLHLCCKFMEGGDTLEQDNGLNALISYYSL